MRCGTFVARGGGLLATHETSRYDAGGYRREADLGLADPVRRVLYRRVEGPMQNAYLHVAPGGAQRHPLLAGLEDARASSTACTVCRRGSPL